MPCAGADDSRQFDTTYRGFADETYSSIRAETFGEDIGQNSWTTADEVCRFGESLGLGPGSHLLDLASGSGGPDLFLAGTLGCRVTGVDTHAQGTSVANESARGRGLTDKARFVCADVREPLPFPEGRFDAVLSIDAFNHFFDLAGLLRECFRVLRPGGGSCSRTR